MKPLVILSTMILTLAVVCSFTRPALAADEGFSSIVILTAKDVKSAADIELAIYRTTDAGTHPGAVFLDGMYGPFVYAQAQESDQTIDIVYSNLTLRGVNGAIITGSNGIIFGAIPVENIVIENLAMECSQNCITSWGPHRNIRIQNNTFTAGGAGILVTQTSDWTITGNTIRAGWAGIYLVETSQAGNVLVTLAASSQPPVGSVCWVEPSTGMVMSDTAGNLIYTSQVRCASVPFVLAEGAVHPGSITP